LKKNTNLKSKIQKKYKINKLEIRIILENTKTEIQINLKKHKQYK